MKILGLRISGFKKFSKLDIKFNTDISVIVGENESGKSSLLTALDIVLNQSIFSRFDSSLLRYLNMDEINHFFSNPTEDNLPKIDIEVFLDFGNSLKSIDFSGVHDNNPTPDSHYCGIKFLFEMDTDFLSDVNLDDFAQNRVIPIEYYKATWNTFQGRTYKRQMLPGKTIFLDNSSHKYDLFGNYARNLYQAKISTNSHRMLSSDFKQNLQSFTDNHKEALSLTDDKYIGFDSSKADILKLIDIYERGISIQDMGRGRENLVKTETSLSNSTFDIIFIDEPENHLSFTNTRKLINILKERTNEQVILVSHSSLVVSRLDLKNLIWLAENKAYSLKHLDNDTSAYFSKIDNLDILRFILAEKVILVEGAAEYITLPVIYSKVLDSTLESDGVEIISMGSISYERYRKISESLNKKVSVITDNDGKESEYNNTDLFKVFSDEDLNNWTFEVAFYNENTELFDEIYKDKKTTAEYKGQELSKACAHMLKNKTENAIYIEDNIDELNIPAYLREAVKWIKE